jgi:Ni,Fe-hydrogenase I small subunit
MKFSPSGLDETSKGHPCLACGESGFTVQCDNKHPLIQKQCCSSSKHIHPYCAIKAKWDFQVITEFDSESNHFA